MTDVHDLSTWATGRDHRTVQARLVTSGWNVCGVGDWAVTLRSPDGHLAARVAPFDPAYPVFVELCRRRSGSPCLPRIEADVALTGGGQLTVMDFLLEAPAGLGSRVRASWEAGDDPALAAVRQSAEELDEEAARSIPYWDGIDLNPGNVRVGADGRPRLLDLFCIDGAAMYAALTEAPEELAQRIPADERRHMAEIAYIARSQSAADVTMLSEASARLAGPMSAGAPVGPPAPLGSTGATP